MHRKSLNWFVIIVLVIAGLPLIGLSEAAASETVTIGLSLPNLDDSFFVGMSKGAAAAAEDLQIGLEVVGAGNDPAAELANVQALIDTGVAAILLSPISTTASLDAIKAANDAGVPVLLAGVNVNMADALVVASVVPDNLQGGWLAGSVLCAAVESTGAVMELVGDPAVESMADRNRGFELYMADQCADVTVYPVQTAGLEREAIVDAVIAALREQTVNGVFATSDQNTLAALEASIIARKGGMSFVGFDASNDALAALEQGRLQAIITPVGWAMGAIGVDAANSHVKGTSIPANIRVELGVLDVGSLAMFRNDPESGKFEGDPREGSFEGDPGSGHFEGDPDSGKFGGDPDSGRYEGDPDNGRFEGGPGSGSFEGDPDNGRFEGDPDSGKFEGDSGNSG